MRQRERIADKEGKRAALVVLVVVVVGAIPLWLLLTLNRLAEGIECFRRLPLTP